MTLRILTRFSALALMAGLSFGCASTSDLEAVRSTAQQAQSTANEAKSIAQNALDTANEARSIASNAEAMSRATDEKINRMFQRSMYK